MVEKIPLTMKEAVALRYVKVCPFHGIRLNLSLEFIRNNLKGLTIEEKENFGYHLNPTDFKNLNDGDKEIIKGIEVDSINVGKRFWSQALLDHLPMEKLKKIPSQLYKYVNHLIRPDLFTKSSLRKSNSMTYQQKKLIDLQGKDAREWLWISSQLQE